jgi:hypothetical protein
LDIPGCSDLFRLPPSRSESAFRYPLRECLFVLSNSKSAPPQFRALLTLWSPCSGHHAAVLHSQRAPPRGTTYPRASKCAVVPVAFDPPRPLNWRPRLHLSATNLLRDTSSCSNKCSSAVYHPVNPHERGPLGCPHAQALGGGHDGSTPERFRAILATARAVAPFSSSPGPARLRCDRATAATGCFGHLALPALPGAGSEWRRFAEGSPTRARARRRHGTCAQYATPRNVP